ncbi:MAG TPA: antibiotic biosynthesis monooxygenase [Bauldia sp.]|nr:antibiotic biosynthesis monooxygenase [Bauldia sp.]
MSAYNVVRFKVKSGREAEFLELQKQQPRDEMKGLRKLALIKTGDRTYCLVGEWRSMGDIVNARPAMIASLDRMRPLLEDLGGGLGVTDPVSGDAVIEITP